MPLSLTEKRRRSHSEIDNNENGSSVKAKRKCNKSIKGDQNTEKPSEKAPKLKTKMSANMQSAIEEYKMNRNLKAVANKFYVPQTSLKRQLELLGLYKPSTRKKMEFKASKKEKENWLKQAMKFYVENEMVLQYEIAKKFNICQSNFRSHLKKLNLIRPKEYQNKIEKMTVLLETPTADSLGDGGKTTRTTIDTTIDSVVIAATISNCDGSDGNSRIQIRNLTNGIDAADSGSDNNNETIEEIQQREELIAASHSNENDMLPSEKNIAEFREHMKAILENDEETKLLYNRMSNWMQQTTAEYKLF